MTDSPSASTAETKEGPVTSASTKSIRSSLLRYRVLAWVTGVWLLLLVVEIVLVALSGGWSFWNTGLTAIDSEGSLMRTFKVVPIIHGWIYFVYLIMTVDLGIRARWGASKIITTAIAGTIPFLSFWFEHVRTREVKQEFKL